MYVPDQATNPLNIEPTGNVIENNFIGLDATGAKATRQRAGSGVADFGTGNTYGGTTAGLGNVISGNATGGIKASRKRHESRGTSLARTRPAMSPSATVGAPELVPTTLQARRSR